MHEELFQAYPDYELHVLDNLLAQGNLPTVALHWMATGGEEFAGGRAWLGGSRARVICASLAAWQSGNLAPRAWQHRLAWQAPPLAAKHLAAGVLGCRAAAAAVQRHGSAAAIVANFSGRFCMQAGDCSVHSDGCCPAMGT